MVPSWKKWLSFLFEVHVESMPSDLNPHLYISLQKGRYQLSTANAIYSFEDLYDNFRLAFKQINLKELSPKKILILGGGLLSVPIIIERQLDGLEFTIIEYDEHVSILASKYAMPKIRGAVDTIITDASIYVDLCNDIFDLIVVDLFDDDRIPVKFASQSFLQSLEKILAPKGLIIYNRLSKTKKDLTDTHQYYHQIFKSYFPSAHYLDVNGNWILLHSDHCLMDVK